MNQFKIEVKQAKIKSSALGYAIVFLLLIGLISAGVLFVTSVNKRLEFHYAMKEHLILDNYFSLLAGSRIENAQTKTMLHPAGDTSIITTKPWGAFNMVVSKTFHKNKYQQKAALIGFEYDHALPAFYLSDNNQALKIAGDTKIEGTAYIPQRGIERAYISGKNYNGDQLVYGDEKKSEAYLPKLKKQFQNLSLSDFNQNTIKLSTIGKDSSYSFDQKTNLFSTVQPIYITNKISGNIIIHSFDSIVVGSKANLENVIIISPKIIFQEGFKGSVQALATTKIVCEKNVQLMYPSTLYLNEIYFNTSEQNNHITLHENVKVLGGILMVSQESNYRKPIFLSTSENTLIGGIVYNCGVSELRGSILGHLYTQGLNINAGGGQYSNLLMDCTISSKRLPKKFIIPNWMDETKDKGKPKIILSF